MHTRAQRKRQKLFLAEGHSVIKDAIAHGARVEELVMSKDYYDSEFDAELFENVDKVFILDDKIFAGVATTQTPKGILATVESFDYSLEEILEKPNALIAVAYQISDPGNLGTIIRTSFAFGAAGLLISRGSVDPYNAKVVRSAAGCLFSLPFVDNLDLNHIIEQARLKQYKTISMVRGEDSSIDKVDMRGPTMIILGNEAHGLPEEILNLTDIKVEIPIAPECESLNLSVAHAICMWEAKKQRTQIDKMSK